MLVYCYAACFVRSGKDTEQALGLRDSTFERSGLSSSVLKTSHSALLKKILELYEGKSRGTNFCESTGAGQLWQGVGKQICHIA